MMSETNEGSATVNRENMNRFDKVYRFFRQLVEDEGGKIRIVDMAPESIHASIIVELPMVDLNGDVMKSFVDVLKYMDTFEVKSSGGESVVINASVYNVWA